MFLPKYLKFCLFIILVLSACTPKPTEPLVLPTLIQFPTLTPALEAMEDTTSVESSSTITPISSTPVVLYVNVDTTNIFVCPDLTCEIVATVENGQALNVIHISTEWYQLYNETISGYVLSQTLIDTPDVTVTATETALADLLTASPTPTIENNVVINTPQPNVEVVESDIATNSSTSSVTTATNSSSGSNTIIVIPTLIQGGNNVNSTATSPAPTNRPVNTPVPPTATPTTTRTSTATATTSFSDLPDVPDSVLTPVILGDPGLPDVVTATPEPDTALPTIQQMPTDVPPGS